MIVIECCDNSTEISISRSVYYNVIITRSECEYDCANKLHGGGASFDSSIR